MITKMDMATTDTMAVLHKAMASNIRTRATDANHRLVKPSVRARAEEGLDLDPDLGRPEMVPVQAPMRLTLIPMFHIGKRLDERAMVSPGKAGGRTTMSARWWI
jgi:hypothetical protein